MRKNSIRFAVIGSLASLLLTALVSCSKEDPAPAEVTPAPDGAAVPDGGAGDATTGDADAAAPTEAGPPKLPTGYIDRAARPLGIFLSINPADRNSWNQEFAYYPTEGAYEAEIQNNLVAADNLDNAQNFDAGTVAADASAAQITHPLEPMMFRDLLVVDSSKPFSPTGYLEIENEVFLSGPAHTTCGGRWLGDDAIDKTLSFVAKGTLTGVSDGVSAATKAPTLTFPYLAPPN
jgi:hypothetical protein